MTYGKGFTVMMEISSPWHWLPVYRTDPDTKLYRLIWLCFGVAVLPIGYVEHRMILLTEAYNKGWKDCVEEIT